MGTITKTIMRNISLFEFNKLYPGQQYFILETFGTYLHTSFIKGQYQIALFWLPCDLSGFYVAVEVELESDKIKGCTGFIEYEKLDPFLIDIDVEPIYALL